MSEFWRSAYMVYETVGNWFGWYLGGFDNLLSSLAVFVMMGSITSGMCAVIDHRVADGIAIRNVFPKHSDFYIGWDREYSRHEYT